METISISPLNPKDVYAQIPTISKIQTLHGGRYWEKDIEIWEIRKENGKTFVVKTVEWSGLVFENGVNMYKDYKREVMFSISTFKDFEIWLKTREIQSYETKPQEVEIQGEVSASVTEVLEGEKNMLNGGKRIDREFLRSYIPQIGDKITFGSLTESGKIFFTYEVEWVRAWEKRWEIKIRFLNKSGGKEKIDIHNGVTSEFLWRFVHWWDVRIERRGYKEKEDKIISEAFDINTFLSTHTFTVEDMFFGEAQDGTKFVLTIDQVDSNNIKFSITYEDNIWNTSYNLSNPEIFKSRLKEMWVTRYKKQK